LSKILLGQPYERPIRPLGKLRVCLDWEGREGKWKGGK